MDASTFLYDVPPVLIERLCKVLDTGDGRFGWRGLAVRVVPSLLEVRMLERVEAAGRSPTWELLWSWSQQNKRVQDLLNVLQDLGHHRALQLLRDQADEWPVPPNKNHHAESRGPPPPPAATAKTSGQTERSPASGPEPARLCLWSGESPPPAITFKDVTEGTRDFHRDARISEGHFSDVYRAQIGNQTVAVKLFKQTKVASWKKLWDIFRKEMEIHHLYQHPNILDLLCCFSDEGRYCLVYPYLPNGSLSHRLHQRGEQPLTWRERLSIIKGTAKALHHLHTAQPCPVICGNISSANILLDDALQPRLSNFGTSRLRPRSAVQHCTITLDTRNHGDPGYLSEEFIRDGKLSFSLDVYSFGMVIMETMTGRKVIEETPKHTLLREVLVGEVEASGGVDSCLQLLDGAAGRWPAGMALGLLRLALDCTASRPRSRPSSETVILALSRLLPPPCCPPADQPHSLDHGDPLRSWLGPTSSSSSVPVEHDEHRSPPGSLTEAGPRECSQSEVTYLSVVRSGEEAGALGEEAGALGEEAGALGEEAGALGEEAGALGEEAGALGEEAGALDQEVGALGEEAGALGEEAGALGEEAGALGEEAGALGQEVGALGEEAGALGEEVGALGEEAMDLYGSWPVQCSCPAEAGGPVCEDCQANGFTADLMDEPPDVVVENAAKKRLRNKLSLYDKGLIRTEELISETGRE